MEAASSLLALPSREGERPRQQQSRCVRRDKALPQDAGGHGGSDNDPGNRTVAGDFVPLSGMKGGETLKIRQ